MRPIASTRACNRCGPVHDDSGMMPMYAMPSSITSVIVKSGDSPRFKRTASTLAWYDIFFLYSSEILVTATAPFS